MTWTGIALPGLLSRRAQLTPAAPAFMTSVGGDWVPLSWRDLLTASQGLAARMGRLGLRAGDRVAIVAGTCQRWEIAQLAILGAGGIVVGLDPHDPPDRLEQILELSAPAALFVPNEAVFEAIPPGCRNRLRFAISFGDSVSAPPLMPWPDPSAEPEETPSAEWDGLSADAPATIVFTSGTTGTPKGVLYTHRQIVLACEAILNALPEIDESCRLACWMPLSNLYQRIMNHCAMIQGASSYFVEDPREILRLLPTIRPRLFTAVPRFYEKVYQGIVQSIGTAPWRHRTATRLALKVSEGLHARQRQGRPPSLIDRWLFPWADRRLLAPLRALFGDDLAFLISGSAPMPRWLLERFHACGLLVMEAYGMTENVVPIAINRPEAFRFGSVGRPLLHNEVRIAADGELLVRGPGVFTGYYRDAGPAPNRDPEGFLASGDYAEIDNEGYVWLTGRKSEIFKTSTGRRIAPHGIESHLATLPYVEHAVVFGRNQKTLTALLVVARDEVARRCGPPHSDRTITAMKADLAAVLANLPDYQRPNGFLIRLQPFSAASGELTPNLKLRRAVIEARLAGQLKALYDRLQQARRGDSVVEWLPE